MTSKNLTICNKYTIIDDTALGRCSRNVAHAEHLKHISCRAGLPTTVWSYCIVSHPGTVAEDGTFNYPALTISAMYNEPVQIERVNDLVDEHSKYIPYSLLTDQTLYWSNPPRGLVEQDESGNILWNNDEDDENAEVFGPAYAFPNTLVDSPLKSGNSVTEDLMLYDTEIWESHNFTDDTHPIHIPLVMFQVFSRDPKATALPEPLETGC